MRHFGSKLPVDGGTLSITTLHPGINFVLELRHLGYAAVKTLFGQDREFNLSHIEPTGFFRCVVHVKLLHQGKGVFWREGLVKGGWRMGIEVVLDQHNLAACRTMGASQCAHKVSIVEGGAPF